MSELLPCPFCESTGWWRDKNTAIEKWNTRHYPPEVQILIDEAKPRKLIASSYDKDIVFCPRCRDAYSLKKIRSLCAEVDKSECPRCKQALDWGEE